MKRKHTAVILVPHTRSKETAVEVWIKRTVTRKRSYHQLRKVDRPTRKDLSFSDIFSQSRPLYLTTLKLAEHIYLRLFWDTGIWSGNVFESRLPAGPKDYLMGYLLTANIIGSPILNCIIIHSPVFNFPVPEAATACNKTCIATQVLPSMLFVSPLVSIRIA